VTVNKHHELRKIARADLSVTALGLGTAPLGGLYTAVEESAALAVIDEAIDQGIKYFDTAPLYGNGLAESRLGKGLGTARAKVVTISTKVGRLLIKDGEGNLSQTTFDYTAQGMRQAMAESLDRLQLPKVDIAYIHDPDDFPDQAINQAYPELAKMRDEGIVSAIGVGINQNELAVRFVKETDLNVVLIAGRYTLLDQSADTELLPLAKKKNVSIVVGGVFNSGILANPVVGATYNYAEAPIELIERAVAIREMLKDWNIPLTAAAIQFPMSHPAVTSVLTGARSVTELTANIRDFNVEIPEECWKALANF
jgi:D-threo-aldose 1-dehydrogenase